MRIAFYAPLKPPGHPTPSGDRRIARLFLEALRRAGHQPFVASRLRSFDSHGDARRQAGVAAFGQRIVERLLLRAVEESNALRVHLKLRSGVGAERPLNQSEL